VDSIANDITSNINEINSAWLKAWIIDLRINTGGNMYPILLGLKEFIGGDNACQQLYSSNIFNRTQRLVSK